MKAEDAVRLLKFVKKHGMLVEKQSGSKVRRHLITLIVVLALAVFLPVSEEMESRKRVREYIPYDSLDSGDDLDPLDPGGWYYRFPYG